MRPRFSLRNLLIAFTIIAVVLGAGANYVWNVIAEVRRHRAAVLVLEEQGVFVPGYSQFKVYRKPRNQGFARYWIDSKAFATSGNITFLEADHVTDAAKFFGALSDLKGIHNLDLQLEELTPARMDSVIAQRELDVLDLAFDEIHVEAVAKFERLPELALLRVEPPVSDALLAAIARMPLPMYLDIDISKLGPEGIKWLGRVQTRSGELRIHGGLATAELLGAIVSNPGIDHISAHDGKITAEALEQLRGAKSIRVLWLSEKDLPEDYLSVVTTLPNIRDLQIARDGDWAAIHIYDRHKAEGLFCEIRKDVRVGAKELRALKSLNHLTGLSFTGELAEEAAKDFL